MSTTTLSPTNAAALKCLAKFNDDKIKKITDLTFKALNDGNFQQNLEPEESGAQIGLATLIAIMARQASTAESIAPVLKDAGFSQNSISYITTQYTAQVDILRAQLANITFTYPRIIGCNWRLDYAVSNSETGRVLEPQFFVQIDLEGGSNIKFTCNEEEMTALVASLKDAAAEASRTSF